MGAISDVLNSASGGMAVPNVLNDANIYVDGKDWLGKADVKLPDIKQKMQSFSAMGMAGETEVPVVGHTDKLEGSIKFKAMTYNAAAILYDPSIAPLLDARASIQRYNPATGQMQQYPCKYTIRGFFKEIKSAEFKQGSDAGGEATYTAHYIKVEIDSIEVLEIDQFNYIYKVNGVDLLVEVRANLGK